MNEDQKYQQYLSNGGTATLEEFNSVAEMVSPEELDDMIGEKKKDQPIADSQPMMTSMPISSELDLNPSQEQQIAQAQSQNSMVSDATGTGGSTVSDSTSQANIDLSQYANPGQGNFSQYGINMPNTPIDFNNPNQNLQVQVPQLSTQNGNVPIQNADVPLPKQSAKALLGLEKPKVSLSFDDPNEVSATENDVFKIQPNETLETTQYDQPKTTKLEVITSGNNDNRDVTGQPISKEQELQEYQGWQSKGWGKILATELNGRPQFEVNDAGQQPIKELLGIKDPNAYDQRAATDKAMSPILQNAEVENKIRKEQEAEFGADYIKENGLLSRDELANARLQKSVADFQKQGYSPEDSLALANQAAAQTASNNNKLTQNYIGAIMDRGSYVNDMFEGKAKENAAFTDSEKSGWNKILTNYSQDFADYIRQQGDNKFGIPGDYNFELVAGSATGRRRILDDFFAWKKQNMADYSLILKNRDEQLKMDINKAVEDKDPAKLQQLRAQRNDTTIAKLNQESALFQKLNADEISINKDFDVTEKRKMDAAQEYAGYQNGNIGDVLSYSTKAISDGLAKVAADVVTAPFALVSPISKTTRQLNQTVNSELQNPFNILQSGWSDEVKVYKDENTGKTYEERLGFVYDKDKNGQLSLNKDLSYKGTKGLTKVDQYNDFNIASAGATVVNMSATMLMADNIAGVVKSGANSKLLGWAAKSAEALGKENILTKSLYTAAEAAQSYNKASALSWSYVTARQNMQTAQEAGLTPAQSFAYTIFQSAATGLMTRVSPDDIFFKEYSAANKNIFRLLSQNKIEEAKLVGSDFVKKYAKSAFSENTQEFAEQGVQDFINNGFNYVAGKDKDGKDKFEMSGINDYFNIGEQTSSYTFLLNAVNALGRGNIRTKGMNNLERAIVASQIPQAKEILYDLSDQSLTGYTFDKANEMLTQIKEVEKYTKQIPDGVQLDVKQTADVIIGLQKAEALKSEIKNNGDSPVNGVLKTQLDEINTEINNTLQSGLENAKKNKYDLNAKTGDQLIKTEEQANDAPETTQRTQAPETTQGQGTEANNPVANQATEEKLDESNNLQNPISNETEKQETALEPEPFSKPATPGEQPDSTPDASRTASEQEPIFENAEDELEYRTALSNIARLEKYQNEQNGTQSANPTNDGNAEPGTGSVQQEEQPGANNTQKIPAATDSRGSEGNAEVDTKTKNEYKRPNRELNKTEQDWYDRFDKAKADGDRTEIVSLYDKLRVALNGITESEALKNLKEEIEAYGKSVSEQEQTPVQPTAPFSDNEQAQTLNENQYEINGRVYTQSPDGSFTAEDKNGKQRKVTNPKTIAGLNQLAEARTKGEVIDTKESNGYVWNKYANGSEEIISPKGSKIEPNGKNKKGKTVTNANFTKNKARIFGQKTDNEIKVEYEQRTKEALDNFYPTNASEAAKLYFANNGKVSSKSISEEVLGNSNKLQARGINPRKLTDYTWAYLGKGTQNSIEKVAEKLAVEYPHLDEQDIRNELIETVNSYPSATEIQEEIVDLYNKSADPYFGFTDEDAIAMQEADASKAKMDFYNSVGDIYGLTDEELLDYYKQQYENSINSLTDEQQDQLYTADTRTESAQQADKNASNGNSISKKQSQEAKQKVNTNSPEYQQLLKNRTAQEERVKSAKEKFDRVNKTTNKNFQQDQENLFGERQTNGGMFDERADGNAGRTIIAEAKAEYDKERNELTRINNAIRDFENGNASGTGSIDFQTGNQRFTPLTKTAFDKLIDRLQKAFPKFSKVTTDWNNFLDKAKSLGLNINFDANFQIENKNPLIVIHNISERGLGNVMNIGGLPVPSLAITSANNTLSSFGEITLIGDPYLADPKQPANKVFDTDVYSPRYPRSQKSFKSISEQRKFEKEILDLANQNEKSKFTYVDIEDALNDMRSDQIMTAYMVDQNIPFPESKYGNGAREYFYNADGAEQALKDWVDEKTSNYNIEDKIFNGYTPSGNRKYIHHNLENVVKLLKGKIKNGESFSYGAGNIRASASKQFKSIEDVKKDRNKIVSKQDIENLKKETENDLSDLLENLKDNYRSEKNSFSYYDEAAASIGEFAGGKKNALSDTFENLSNEQINLVKDYILKLKNAPTEYFEAKPQRAVNLREFKAAVVPKGTSQKILDQLKQKGITIYEYDSKVDGDRQQKVNQASSEQDVQFMHNANGTVYGAKLPDGTVYINPQHLNANTAIHEFSHLWEQIMPKAWAKGLELFKQTKTGKDLVAQLKKEGNYDNLSEDALWSEAMNTHIGNIGEERYQNPRGKMAEFVDWFKNTMANFMNAIGIKNNWTKETKLSEFTNKTLGDILGEKELVAEGNTNQNNNLQANIAGNNGILINSDNKDEAISKLLEARRYEKEGKSRDEILLKTNWYKGADNKWRYVMNFNLSLKEGINDGNNKNLKLSEIIEYPQLFQYYPELKDMDIEFTDSKDIFPDNKTRAAYNPADNKIYINNGNNKTGDVRELRSSIGHEIQHAIQNIEGTESGTSYGREMERAKIIADKVRNGASVNSELSGREQAFPKIYGENWEQKLRDGKLTEHDIAQLLYETNNGEIESRFTEYLLDSKNNESRLNDLLTLLNVTNERGINFSIIGNSLIPQKTVTEVLDTLDKDGQDAAFEKLKESNWYNNLSANKKTELNAGNLVSSLIDSERRRNEAKNQKTTEKAAEKVKSAKEETQQKIKDLKDKYAQKIAEIKADVKRDSREYKAKIRNTQKQAYQDLVNLITSDKLKRQLTIAETNRLIRKAAEILNANNTNKAVQNFIDLYNQLNTSEAEKQEINDQKYIEKVSQTVSDGFTAGKTLDEIFAENPKTLNSDRSREMARRMYERLESENGNHDGALEKSLDATKQVEKAIRGESVFSKLKTKEGFKNIINNIKRKWIKEVSDRQFLPKHLMKKLGMKGTYDRMIAYGGASASANNAYQKVHDKIFSKMTNEDKTYHNEIIKQRRVIAIDENREKRGLEPIDHELGNNKYKAQAALIQLKAKIGEKKYNELNQKATDYFDAFKGLLAEMKQSGLINQAQYDSMVETDYRPTQFMNHLFDMEFETDADGNLILNKEGNPILKEARAIVADNFSDSVTGLSKDQIKSIKQGSTELILNDSELLLANAMLGRKKAMFMNEVNKTFINKEFPKAKLKYEELKSKDAKELTSGDRQFIKYFEELQTMVKENPMVGITKSGNPKFLIDQLPTGWKRAYYFENGIRKEFLMRDDFYEQWHDTMDKLIGETAKDVISTISGSALTKMMATGRNPGFALVNTPRDFGSVVMFSPEYSKFSPYATMQLMKDAVKGAREIYRYNNTEKDSIVGKYLDYGGGMDFLNTEGETPILLKYYEKFFGSKTNNKTKSTLSNVFDMATFKSLSNYSEMMFRIATFDRAVQNRLKKLGVDKITDLDQKTQDNVYYSAVASARSVLDFNQGGRTVKAMEAVVPYINAATQGTRVLADRMTESPYDTTSRLLQGATMLTSMALGLSLLAMKAFGDDDKEDTFEKYLDVKDRLSPFQKRGYFHFFSGNKNADGEYDTWKIAVPQALTPFYAIADALMDDLIRMKLGKETKGWDYATTQFSEAVSANVDPFGITEPTKIATKNPFIKAAVTYASGYDFFRDQSLDKTINKVPKAVEGYQNKKVEDFYKKWGLETGMSPVRMKAAVESIVTSPETNMFLGMIYGGVDQITGYDSGFSDKKGFVQTTANSLLKRITAQTSEYGAMQNMLSAADRKAIDQKAAQETLINLEADKIMNRYKSPERLMSAGQEINQFIQRKDIPMDQKIGIINTIVERVNNYEMTGGGDPRIWDIKYNTFSSADAQAEAIVRYYGKDFQKKPEVMRQLVLNNVLTEKVWMSLMWKNKIEKQE